MLHILCALENIYFSLCCPSWHHSVHTGIACGIANWTSPKEWPCHGLSVWERSRVGEQGVGDAAQGVGDPSPGSGKWETPGFTPSAHAPGPRAAGDCAHTQPRCLSINTDHRKTSSLGLFQDSATSTLAWNIYIFKTTGIVFHKTGFYFLPSSTMITSSTESEIPAWAVLGVLAMHKGGI